MLDIDLSFLRFFIGWLFKIDLVHACGSLDAEAMHMHKKVKSKIQVSFPIQKLQDQKHDGTRDATIKTIQMKSILLDKYKYVVTRYFFDQQINTQVKQYNQQKINKRNTNTRYKTRKYESYPGTIFFFYYRKRRINYKINLQFYTYTSLRVRPGGNDWDNFSALSESSTVKVYKYLEHLILNFVHFLRLAILTDLASLRRAIRRKSRISVICLGC